MSTTKFKSTIKCEGCVAKVTNALNESVGEGKWSVDLKDPSRILSVEGEVDETRMKEALENVGYKADRIDP